VELGEAAVVVVVEVVVRAEDGMGIDSPAVCAKVRLSCLFSLQIVSVSFSITDANSLFISSATIDGAEKNSH
jgi:hypothetical protein